jgi:hypothetical protein
MPLAYIVTISHNVFNWGAMMSKQLSIRVEQACIEIKSRQNPLFLYGLISIRCNLCNKCISRIGVSFACLEISCSCLFQCLMGE